MWRSCAYKTINVWLYIYIQLRAKVTRPTPSQIERVRLEHLLANRLPWHVRTLRKRATPRENRAMRLYILYRRRHSGGKYEVT